MVVETVAIASVGTVLTQARSLLRGLKQSKLSSEHATAVSEALDLVSDVGDRLHQLQISLLALQQENSTLKAQIAASNNWETRFANYKLAKTPVGGFVLKSVDAEVPHFACLKCAESKKEIHVLQDDGEYAGTHGCRACGTHYATFQARNLDPNDGFKSPI